MLAQSTVVRRGRDRVFSAPRREYVERKELIPYSPKLSTVTNALQHFAQD